MRRLPPLCFRQVEGCITGPLAGLTDLSARHSMTRSMGGAHNKKAMGNLGAGRGPHLGRALGRPPGRDSNAPPGRCLRPWAMLALTAFLVEVAYEPLHLLTETHHGVSDVARVPLLAAFECDDHGEGDHRTSHEPHSAYDHQLTRAPIPSSQGPVIHFAFLPQAPSSPLIESRPRGFTPPLPLFEPRAPPFPSPWQPRAPPTA